MGKNDYNFVSANSYQDLVHVFRKVFGTAVPSHLPNPYGYGTVMGHFRWKEDDLDVAFTGSDDGPLVVHATTPNRGAKNTLKEIDKYFGVKPAKIFREAIGRRVEEKYLNEFERKIDWVNGMLVLIAAFMLVLGIPNDIRWELLLIIAVVSLVNRYSKLQNAVDIRLFLLCSFWYLLPGIPMGIIYILAILVAYFFPYSFPLTSDVGFVSMFIVLILLWLIFAIACGFGGVPSKKMEAKWKYLSSSRNPHSLDIAIHQVTHESPSFLLGLAFLVMYTFLIRNILLFDEIVRIAVIISMILLLPFAFLFLYQAFKRINGLVYRQHLLTMAKDLPDFNEIVTEIGAEDERRRKHHVPIKFG
jgi:hypothetical protein